MVCAEASGACAWVESPTNHVLGRPACTALPTARAADTPTLSLGCAGMRTFTEVSQDKLLMVVPGDRLDGFADDVARKVGANAAMQQFYDQRKVLFAET
jgi:uncharacterized protein (DUF169 family)